MAPFDTVSVDQVVEKCNCTKARAITLLTIEKGNVDAAVALFWSKEQASPTPPPTPPPFGMPPHGGRSPIPPRKPVPPYSKSGATPPSDPTGLSGGDPNDIAESNNHNPPDDTTDGLSHDGISSAEGDVLPHPSEDQPPRSDLSDEKIYVGPTFQPDHDPPQAFPKTDEPDPEEDSMISEETQRGQPSDGSPDEEPLPPPEWDFVLPAIDPPARFIPGGPDGTSPFSLRELAGAIQSGVNYLRIRAYLIHYEHPKTRNILKSSQEAGVPIMFYAVATNDEWIIREVARFGGDVNSVYGPQKIPLLAFAIINSENLQRDTTLAVATLLSLGATVDCIPKEFYSPFYIDLPDFSSDSGQQLDLGDENKQWCSSALAFRKFESNLNVSQRYYMEKSTKIKRPSVRARQVAKLRAAEPLLGVPYFLIGQIAAASLVTDHLLSYMTRIVQGKRPLVMVFAGPSGHGKTELARRLGHLLSLDIEVVDCTSFSREDELFGPRSPYTGSDKGSPLNNFLARKNGQSCIVFLDEFERTTVGIHNALLIPFDKGEYEDRRNRSAVNCSKTIWVLATNAMDDKIKAFCEEHKAIIFNDRDHSQRPVLIKKLSKVIKQEFKTQFMPSITGRVSAFIPFLPFTRGEQIVGAHKFLLEFADELRQPTNLHPGPSEQLMGNIRLHIKRDASICSLIAAEGYDADLGIRSLISAVREAVEFPVFESFIAVNALIEEGGGPTDMVINLSDGDIAVTTVMPKDDDEDDEDDETS